MHKIFLIILTILNLNIRAQKSTDTTVKIGAKIITLSEVVVNNKLNVPAFIEKIKNDTSFYKAFKNLRV